MEVAEKNRELKEQSGIDLMEISSDDNYKIESEGCTGNINVTERVTDDFLKYTYNRLKEIDSKRMCVEPWPPRKSVSSDGTKLHYRFPRSTRLLDIVLHKDRGETISPYIELLYELANHMDTFHSAGWIFRSLRAKNVWILETKKKEQNIVIPKFGKYRMIVSSEYDTHLEQIKVENREDVDAVQWLPIEAIKAGLYSKESDVYAFGMITWEVMSAFGQEGVVYDQDEERELTCIPFNYQQSENILQHLIEGYIPEKPAKCPDWFYQEITRPCLLHQKIDRPSMKTILQILQTRLHKALPKQIISNPSTYQDLYQDSNQYEDFCDDYDDRSKLSTPVARSPPTPLPAPTSFQDVDAYYDDDDDDDDAISSPTLSALFLKESKPQDPSKHQSPIREDHLLSRQF
uniref:Fibroblast growth factor receptor 4-like n=1 Tax=Crassostrea virginica TaxID=6565 RepID=A0A8B8CIC8_CRAVI|nr:fibroblast growth factor receptor 4-like [Crassostrea virginica]